MSAICTFSDSALFNDGAGFQLWTPPKVSIIRRCLTFYDPVGDYERARDFSEFGSSPARHCYLLETTDGGGSQLDVWLRVTEYRSDLVEGVLDASTYGGPMLPLRWSPAAGLHAPEAISWAAGTFGRRHSRKVAAELAAMCARLWAGVPRGQQ